MTTFADLGLPRSIVNVLTKQGITEPFPIQEAAIPNALAGKDVLGRGPTGSGKTFTFGLPMLAQLAGAPSKPGHPRGLILTPTRELATQVRERLDDPAAALGLRLLDIVGGVNINHHIRALAAPVDLLVATPGRAEDLINQGKLHFDHVEITAIDEADQMADMGFLPQVRKLLDRTPKGGQRLLFSATLDGDVDKLVKRYMHNPVTHSTAPVEASVDTMEHYQLIVGGREERNEIVLRIGARPGKTIMFMRTKHGVDRQVKKLRRVGIHADGIHGDKGQGARTRALEGFANGSCPVLVATDIAARGIDIDDVSLVVHVDPPAEHKAYLHRAGRTARAGTSGTVVTLVMDDQQKEVDTLLKKAGVDAKRVRVTPDSEELVRITLARKPQGSPLPPPGQPTQPKQGNDQGRSQQRNRRSHRGRSGSNRRRNSLHPKSGRNKAGKNGRST
ncbi:DEAD/DEAH box helicase [Corynebacterium cystitidis]|uniref:Superfamily II DNA and RNA helicase n=1 Tax=Corynebacterium cystitidis DSM 20524 TaxID=1121357 RepID=A0A1H9PTY2_9CORY|nr:DEAD/DEAH box helicase [Corynebacterium cystitidis]WJY82386.1 ATP-dependent RNA helicase RhlE [Corynebacterium cystitidis DSM 20524]SER51588.1 Superfamily II DNA and RNA helicase [Corynebacterium cystitidis DSM 20524]SNV76051.1 putative helicase [Corynebacterium cystitidis]